MILKPKPQKNYTSKLKLKIGGLLAMAIIVFGFINPSSNHACISFQKSNLFSIDSSSKDTVKYTQLEYKGGEEAFYRFLEKKLKFPKSAKKARQSCTVQVSFMVDINGNIDSISTQGCDIAAFNHEAVRVIKLTSGKWIPARRVRDNTPVRTKSTIPIDFSLE